MRLPNSAPLALAVALCVPGCGSSPVSPAVPSTADFTIQYIHRLPEIEYVWNGANPTRQGWPAVGQPVVWQATVKNWADQERTVGCEWSLDGGPPTPCVLTIPAGGTAVASYPWTWVFERHRLEFRLDPAGAVAEEEEGNNTLAVWTDALSLGFYVEQSFYDYFRVNQPKLIGAHSSSFEDWAQRQVARMNDMFAAAIFPETPNGVLDRWRLDRITLVPDGTLPLDPITAPGALDPSQTRPRESDRTVDLQWGFPAAQVHQGSYDDVRTVADQNQFYYSGFLQHELGHARYLIDVYGFDVLHFSPAFGVAVLGASGELLAGTAALPGVPINNNGQVGLKLHSAPPGLMNAQWTFVDRYSAAALNRIAGARATRGNYNGPENIGAFLNDLPAHNLLRVEDAEGHPLGGAQLSVFRATRPLTQPPFFWPYSKYFDNVPDQAVQADAQGIADLGPNPFGGSMPIVMNGVEDSYTNGDILVRVRTALGTGYALLDAIEFNLSFWRGMTDTFTYELRVSLRPGG